MINQMEQLFEQYKFLIIIITTFIGIVMAITVNMLRVKSAHRPVNVKRIIIPPLMMSTGLFMFVIPFFRVTWLQVGEALVVGILFSLFLIRTTHFEVKNNDIYIRPSKAFIFILFGLLIIRMVIKYVIGHSIAFGELTGMFFLLAFGMLLTWRFTMLFKYRRLLKKHERYFD